jgi:hypothetical protein
MNDHREDGPSSEEIDAWIRSLGNWRDAIPARARTLIREADPDVVAQVKWRKPSDAMRGTSRPPLA